MLSQDQREQKKKRGPQRGGKKKARAVVPEIIRKRKRMSIPLGEGGEHEKSSLHGALLTKILEKFVKKRVRAGGGTLMVQRYCPKRNSIFLQ